MRSSGIEILFNADNLLRILEGLWVTIRIALISMVFSVFFGVVLGMVMTLKNKIVRTICRIYVEFNRIMPQIVTLFIVYYGFARALKLNFSGEFSAVIVFTFWGTAEIGEIVRGLLTSVPKIQYESAEAIGLSRTQVFGYVVLPQIFKPLLPGIMNLTTRMIKTTSLVFLIGVVEVVTVARQIIDANRFTTKDDVYFWMYGFIFLLYFLICWTISLVAKHLEKKFSMN